MYAGYLNRKCFTASQTVEIFNLVVFPTITYRIGVVTFNAKRISKWDFKVTKINCSLGFNNWSLPSYIGGLNLFRLKDLQVTNSAAVYLNYSANSPDHYAKLLTDPSFHISGTVANIQNTLDYSKLEIVPNYEKLPEHYISGVITTVSGKLPNHRLYWPHKPPPTPLLHARHHWWLD